MGATQCCKTCTRSSEVSIPAGPATSMSEYRNGSSPPALPTLSLGGAQGDRADRIYHVVFLKKSDAKLGIDVDYAPEDTLLPVLSVYGGLAAKWNHDHPEATVMPGDSIIEVNGLSGNAHGMMQKCETEEVLRMTIQRPEHVVPASRWTKGNATWQPRDFSQWESPAETSNPDMRMCCNTPIFKIGC